MILQAVRDKDVGRFQAVKGVGARMAERLVVELKPKLAKWQPVMAVASVGGDASAEVIQEAVAALAQLGYAPAMLMDKVRDLFMPEMTTEELVKRTLQHLSRL
jgi:Holliday junction DNA helicase RuvA